MMLRPATSDRKDSMRATLSADESSRLGKMKSLKNFVGATVGMLSATLFATDGVADTTKLPAAPTVVVHNAWVDASSWIDVIARLQQAAGLTAA
jgi:hypothetical protein